MVTKDELRNYEEDKALEYAKDLLEGGTKTNGQSWRASMLEAHVNSLVGAPLAILAHAGVLFYFGEYALGNPLVFATMTWPIFFYLSITRIYIFRRIFEKHGVHLEPLYLFRLLKNRLHLAKKEKET